LSWIIAGPVAGEVRGDTGVTVRAGGRECWLSVSPDGDLLFDGQRIDVGDFYEEFLAVIDDIAVDGYSEPIDQVTREIEGQA
jgi:hypothetical protein